MHAKVSHKSYFFLIPQSEYQRSKTSKCIARHSSGLTFKICHPDTDFQFNAMRIISGCSPAQIDMCVSLKNVSASNAILLACFFFLFYKQALNFVCPLCWALLEWRQQYFDYILCWVCWWKKTLKPSKRRQNGKWKLYLCGLLDQAFHTHMCALIISNFPTFYQILLHRRE